MVAPGTRGETGDPEPTRASFRRTARTAHEAAAATSHRARDEGRRIGFQRSCRAMFVHLVIAVQGDALPGSRRGDAAEVDPAGPLLPRGFVTSRSLRVILLWVMFQRCLARDRPPSRLHSSADGSEAVEALRLRAGGLPWILRHPFFFFISTPASPDDAPFGFGLSVRCLADGGAFSLQSRGPEQGQRPSSGPIQCYGFGVRFSPSGSDSAKTLLTQVEKS